MRPKEILFVTRSSPWFFFCPVQTYFFLFTVTIDNTTETPGFLSGGKVSLSFVHIIL